MKTEIPSLGLFGALWNSCTWRGPSTVGGPIEHDLDAVFAPSDQMALGALRALHETGRSIPDDVAVVGFDDIEYVSTDGDPPLTTVHQPAREMGRALVRQLLNGPGRQSDPMIFPTHLVVRQSA